MRLDTLWDFEPGMQLKPCLLRCTADCLNAPLGLKSVWEFGIPAQAPRTACMYRLSCAALRHAQLALYAKPHPGG